MRCRGDRRRAARRHGASGATCSSRNAGATCSAIAISRRATSETPQSTLRSTARVASRAAPPNRSTAARFRSPSPRISPTSRRAADSTSSSAIRRGCALHRIPDAQRAAFRRDYAVARAAAWEPGASAAGAGRGFAAQVDVAALFVERSLELLRARRHDGAAPPGEALAVARRRRRATVLTRPRRSSCRVEDHGRAAGVFDAAVYPSLIVARRLANESRASSIQAALVETSRTRDRLVRSRVASSCRAAPVRREPRRAVDPPSARGAPRASTACARTRHDRSPNRSSAARGSA